MKSLIVLSALILSASSLAGDKCYKTAENAAFKYAVENEGITSKDEFRMRFGNENLQVIKKGSWQKEIWSFSDGSMFISVDVDSVVSKCFVKEVFWGQDDQDHE